MNARKITIRYGTSIVPSFSKNIDVVPPSSTDFQISELCPQTRVIEPDGKSKLRRPSISAILGSIEDKKALFQWQKQMIEEMGLANFRKTMNERLVVGIKVHSRVEQMLKLRTKQDFQEKDLIELIDSEKDVTLKHYLKSVFPVILSLEGSENAITEKTVRHPFLAYQGRFDAVINHKGLWKIVDWKTAQVQSSFSKQGIESISYTNYVRQLAAYASAFNYDVKFQSCPTVSNGLLVSLKEDGSEADVFEIDEPNMETSWNLIKLKLQEFWSRVESSAETNVDFAYKPSTTDIGRTS